MQCNIHQVISLHSIYLHSSSIQDSILWSSITGKEMILCESRLVVSRLPIGIQPWPPLCEAATEYTQCWWPSQNAYDVASSSIPEAERWHSVWISFQNVNHFPGICIPYPDCIVIRSRHQATAIGWESYRVHQIWMALQHMGHLPRVVLSGYSIWLLYQDGKEKNNSLCSFVPGGATAIPCWEIWALACWISTKSGGKMLWGWGWKGCRKWWKANMPVVSAGL